ncbi:MAG: JAB domain-containing protein, partial [Bacteroidota bacterium]
VSATVIDPKIVFQEAMHYLASSLVLAHNHPSGNFHPSDADLKITKKLAQAGKMLDIRIMDHLIISSRGYYSFADEGILATMTEAPSQVRE